MSRYLRLFGTQWSRKVKEESGTSIAAPGAASAALTATKDKEKNANLRIATKGLVAGVAGMASAGEFDTKECMNYVHV